MHPTITNRLLEDSTILLRTFSGITNLDFILDSWKRDIEKGIVSTSLHGVISDFTNAKTLFSLKDLRQLQVYYREEYEIFGSFKMAQVIDSPSIIYPKIFEKEEKKFVSKGFSTLDAALAWIIQ